MNELTNKSSDEELTERINLEDALWEACDYLRECKNYIDEIIELEQMNKNCEAEFIRIKSTKESTLVPVLVSFYICGVLFVLATTVANFIMTLIAFAGIATTIVMSRKRIKKKKALPEKRAMEYWESTGSPTCVANKNEIQRLEQELRAFAEENKQKVEFLPVGIRYDYNAVSYIENAIRNGKADSIKEAMQLYDAHLHQLQMQATMQNIANTMYMHNQAMEAYMSHVVEQQKITNSKLSEIENWTFLDYMNSKYGD